MKKLLCTFMAFAFIATAVQAQSLADNSYYLESVRLTEAATAAYNEGDYDTARELALLAQENARLSDQYVAEILAMQAAELRARQAADEAIMNAQERYNYAESISAATRYPVAFAASTEDLAAAYAAFKDKKYDEATKRAGYVMDNLAGISEKAVIVFPASYTVKSLDYKTDCLWRIAAMPFIYNDPMQWPLLYRANKSIMPDPKNPDLIEPGMVLTIPPLAGETREGEYTEGVEYPTMGK